VSAAVRCPRCAAPAASPEARCGVCGSPCDLPPTLSEVVRFERGLAAALLAAFVLLWAAALGAGGGVADVRAPDTVAELVAAWRRGEALGVAAGLALFLAVSLACAVRGFRPARAALQALRARPAPSVGPVPLGAFLVAFGLFVVAGAAGLAGQRAPRALAHDAQGRAQALPLGAEGLELAITREAARIAEGPLGPEDLWAGRLRWRGGVGRLELVATPAAPSSPPPVLVDGRPLALGVTHEVWPGSRITAPGLTVSVDAPSWVERSGRSLAGQVLGLVALLALARVAAPGLLTRLGVRREGLAREVRRGASAYLGFFPLYCGALALTLGLADALGQPAESHPLVRALERDSGGALALLVFAQAALLAPLVEELLYRGVALGGLLRPLGPVGALLGSAVLFAAIHPGFAHFLPMVALGGLFAALRLTSPTGSLVGAVTAHLLHNALTLLLVFAV